MPLRLLARVAPLVLAAVAAAMWVQRRRARPLALPPGPTPSAEPRIEPTPRVPIRRFARAEAPPDLEVRPSGRFVRSAQPAQAPPSRTAPEPIDIVSIVDDLLLSARE